ncbi:transcriptional regulator [Lactiplantibacillus fabifermentans T30PCM01]|uniref:Transcriptional regulator n=1 Tax=Lactiplantibacillus fabifermentans T30PCM01 TaxID=1400520 RepID=W6T3Z3_9LACO|nr:MurR/RpiR family transcriptional regulator [Lactiplantibacillus fabifermentans]ETY72686.1 transcriptional regulator [Lactiplantibacillus fabifermentans T30PCM01]
MLFEERLINVQYRLSDTEDDLADYIRRHPALVAQLSITKLAAICYTVPNTITRLCKKLGYGGYSELKVELQHLQSGEITDNDQLDEQRLISKTFQLISPEREVQVVQRLLKANQVALFAVGETAYPVQDFASTLNAFNHKTSFYTYENQMIYELQHSKNLVVILVSLSGENGQVIKMAEIARKNQHFIVSLTHLQENSLAKLVNLPLYCFSPKHILNGVNLADKVPIYLVLNSLRNRYLEMFV